MTGVLSSMPVLDEHLVQDRCIQSTIVSTQFSSLICKVFGDASHTTKSIVLFTAVDSGSGVSSAACAVAAELAEGGHKVLLAEASALACLSEYEDAYTLCRQVGISTIWVLGRGEVAHSRLPLRAGGNQSSAILAALHENFQHIILDAPSIAENDLAVRLAPSTAGVVMVFRKAKTETRSIVKASRLLTARGGKLLGFVYGNY